MSHSEYTRQDTGCQQPASDEAAIVFRRTALAHLTERWGPVDALRRRLRCREITRGDLRADVQHLLAPDIENVRRERIIDLALDAVESERLCPEVQLPASPRRLPDMPVHALVFNAFPHVANELYPLLVDGYIAQLSHGTRAFQVIGVHENWLLAGRFRRAISLDADGQDLIESDIVDAPFIRSVQVLALDLREELMAQRRIEAAVPGALFTNPSAGTSQLDDKCRTGDCWQQAGLPTPRFVALPSDMPDAERWERISEFSTAHGAAVIKPINGTEGRGVCFAVSATDLPSGALLVMEERGTIRYASATGAVRCTVRVNVSWDGQAACAESGYAQIAATPDCVASAGRGGRLVPLADLWQHLCHADRPLTPTVADWRRILRLAEDGTAVLAGQLGATMPRLIGIDLLLELDADGMVQPVLLEANGRPSGMCHSRFLTANGPGDEPGVTNHFWENLQTHL